MTSLPPPSSSPLTRFFFPVPYGLPPLDRQERRVLLREWFGIERLPGLAVRLGLTLFVGTVLYWVTVSLVLVVIGNRDGKWLNAFSAFLDAPLPILADLLRRIVQFCLGLPYLALSVREAHRKTIAQRHRVLIDRTTTCAHCGYPINRTTNPLCPECGTPTSITSPTTPNTPSPQ